MNTARRVPIRAFIASLALTVPLLGASSASGAVVVNEVETQGVDFIELHNNGAGVEDISNFILKDSNNGNIFMIPAATTIPVGGHLSFDNLGFGLSDIDQARLFQPDGVTLVDGHTWGADPSATYGRCPNGTGAFTGTSSTPGAVNACPIPAVAWPGAATVSPVDGPGVLGQDVSGLAYQPSGTSAPGVLWAVKNDPGTLYRLIWNGTIWTPDTTNGWSSGKLLRYSGQPFSNPDAEGVTLAGGDPNGIYVATERDGGGEPARQSCASTSRRQERNCRRPTTSI